MANRDVEKTEAVNRELGFPKGSYTILPVDLASLDSVRAPLNAVHFAGAALLRKSAV